MCAPRSAAAATSAPRAPSSPNPLRLRSRGSSTSLDGCSPFNERRPPGRLTLEPQAVNQATTLQRPALGILSLDKPAGITSFDAVREVRRIFGERRAGHAG